MGIIGQFDQIIFQVVEKLPASLHSIMILITTIGSPLACVMVLSVITVWAYMHKNKRLTYSPAVLVLAMPLASLLKVLTKRVRPNTPYVQNMLFKTYSFPSGHAYASFMTFGLLIYLALRHMKTSWGKRLTIFGLLLTIILVGISRIYLGAHFPSDVLGGWMLGAIVLGLVIRFSLVHSNRKV